MYNTMRKLLCHQVTLLLAPHKVLRCVLHPIVTINRHTIRHLYNNGDFLNFRSSVEVEQCGATVAGRGEGLTVEFSLLVLFFVLPPGIVFFSPSTDSAAMLE